MTVHSIMESVSKEENIHLSSGSAEKSAQYCSSFLKNDSLRQPKCFAPEGISILCCTLGRILSPISLKVWSLLIMFILNRISYLIIVKFCDGVIVML
jgi:hypothetical protein